MRNCFVKELKVAANADLPRLDELVLKISPADYYNKLILQGSDDFTIRVGAGGGYTTTVPSEGDTPTSEPFTGNNATLYFISGTYDVLISNRTNLTSIDLRPVNADGSVVVVTQVVKTNVIDISSLKYCTSLQSMVIIANVYGDLKEISEMPALTYLYAVYSNIKLSGPVVNNKITSLYLQGNTFDGNDISDVAGFYKASNGDLGADGFTGSIEDFVERRVELSGFSSGNVLINFPQVDFGITKITGRSVRLYWSENGNKIYYNTTKVQAKGYTAEEIATNQAAGGIWAGRTVLDVDTNTEYPPANA